MPRPSKEESWLAEACEMMARRGVSLQVAAQELGYALDARGAETIQRRKSFGRLLWAARFRFHAEVAGDPGRTKDATIGQLQVLAEKLTKDGAYDKAAEVLFKISKMEGWVGPEQEVNVFGSLTASDLAEIRQRLAGDEKKAVRELAERLESGAAN